MSRAVTQPETPLRLAEAAELRGLTVASLRTEAKRGRLTIWRVAGKDWTSLAEIDRMFERCRVPAKAPDSGSVQPDATNPAPSSRTPDGSSRTADASLALAAALATAKRLKDGSPPTSQRNMSPNVVKGPFHKSASRT
jgi:hypothetical protein